MKQAPVRPVAERDRGHGRGDREIAIMFNVLLDFNERLYGMVTMI